MKKLFTLFALALCLTNLKAQFVTIPDANFVTWLQANVPSAMSGNQMDTTSLAVTTRTAINIQSLGIIDITGIQYFDSLQTLNCNSNYLINLSILPNNLKWLDCIYNYIATISHLPNHLLHFWCYNNQLTYLPILPNSLTNIFCNNNDLISLPILPTSLVVLNCSDNQIQNLPALPNTLNNLNCSSNPIHNIPTLPSSLVYLYCSADSLTNLPTLPNSLQHLQCDVNQIVSLPVLPPSLAFLFCSQNQLSNLPILPQNLTTLFCASNNISCFAPFNNNISVIDITNSQFTCLPNYIPAMNASTLNYPLCSGGNANNCLAADGIFGFTYKDNNTNCSKDAGDNGLKNIPLQVYDNVGNLLGQTYSALNGVYQFQQTANTYTIAIDTTGLPFTSYCLFPGLDSTVTVATLDTNINFALTCKPGFDVGVQSISANGIIFPGQNHVLNVNAGDITHWYNLNCASGISGTLSFSVNGPLNYIGSLAGSLTPIVTGNVYTYNISDFGTINNSTDFQLVFQTDVTAQAGDVICVNATVTPVSGDNNTNNNTYTFCYNVVNSYDPNIKETYPENVQPGFNDWLTYTIHFQNTGNAPAFNIRLADTLDAMLDLETFQIINYSHTNLIDLTGNILNVRFPNIQLPDSTTNSAGSIGFIQYRAKPKATWVAPYQIKNTAYIYFDYNAPIVTNTTLNTILISTGLHNQIETVMNLYPNPSNGNFTIELNTKEKQSIQIFDITGHVVLSQSIENGKAIIDGNYLVSGIYNINIKGNNSVANKKLVVVK